MKHDKHTYYAIRERYVIEVNVMKLSLHDSDFSGGAGAIVLKQILNNSVLDAIQAEITNFLSLTGYINQKRKLYVGNINVSYLYAVLFPT